MSRPTSEPRQHTEVELDSSVTQPMPNREEAVERIPEEAVEVHAKALVERISKTWYEGKLRWEDVHPANQDRHRENAARELQAVLPALRSQIERELGERLEELAQAGTDAWTAIEEAMDAFGQGDHVLDEASFLVRLRAAQAKLVPCTDVWSEQRRQAALTTATQGREK